MSDMVGDLEGYVVELPMFAKYAQILKNYLASNATADERIIPDEGFCCGGGSCGVGGASGELGYRLLILPRPYGIFLRISHTYVTKILHAPSLFVTQGYYTIIKIQPKCSLAC